MSLKPKTIRFYYYFGNKHEAGWEYWHLYFEDTIYKKVMQDPLATNQWQLKRDIMLWMPRPVFNITLNTIMYSCIITYLIINKVKLVINLTKGL